MNEKNTLTAKFEKKRFLKAKVCIEYTDTWNNLLRLKKRVLPELFSNQG